MKINIALLPLLLVLVLANLRCGSVDIPAREGVNAIIGRGVSHDSWAFIVLQSRLPQAVTAIFCGAALATSGLLLQTTFRNPLAGPDILGISSGANLGVALVMLLMGGVVYVGGNDTQSGLYLAGLLAQTSGALIGAVCIILLLIAMQTVVRRPLMLLIIGVMISYLASSAVSLLSYLAAAERLKGFVVWGMGTFGNVTTRQLPWFVALNIIGLLLAVLLIKPLNAIQLGEEYARSLGINTHGVQRRMLIVTGLLTGASTAFCGPVAFLGLAVPHVARMMCRTADHRTLLPCTILCGSCVALLCNILCTIPETVILPLNAVTSLLGAPVILYIILRSR